MRIILTGGGTGGHLFPIIAVERALKKQVQENIFLIPPGEGTNLEFMFIGPETIGEESFAYEEIEHKTVMTGKLRRYASLQNIIDIFKIPIGFIQSLWHLFFFMPNAIFSKGGYGSIPVVLAAWIFRIPIIIHESDSIPGLANKFCAKFSKKVAISFLETAKYFPKNKTALTGNPVREELRDGTKEDAKRIFGISGFKPIILILGGSQGSRAINDILFACLPQLLAQCEIIHQCGLDNYESIKDLLNNKLLVGYFLYPFLNEKQLRHAFAASTLVISRAGAGTIAEIAALNKASILIPLPNSAADHQLNNAIEYTKFGASAIIEQMNLTPHFFQNKIFSLLNNSELIKKMEQNTKNYAQPKAAEKIAEEILKIAKW